MQAMLLNKLNLHERLSDVLCGGSVKLLVTPCMLETIKGMGDEYFGAFIQLKRMERVRHCSHVGLTVKEMQKLADAEEEQDKSKKKKKESDGDSSSKDAKATNLKPFKFAHDCVLEILKGTENKHHYMLATQDESLLRKCRKIVGLPTLHIHRNVVILDALSEAMKEDQVSAELLKTLPSMAEKTALKSLLPLGRDKGPRKTTVRHTRKKKAKGPNPLSVKKKSKSLIKA